MPVWEPGRTFCDALEAADAFTDRPDERIVVVDGTPEEAPTVEAPGWRVLYTGRRVGPARARNLGVASADADVILFLDADVSASPDVVERVRRAFADDPELTAVIGSYDDDPGAPGFVSQYRNLLHHYVHQRGRHEASTFWGACGAIRRDVFLSVGGFDEAYDRPSVEDIELGYRLTDAGHRIRLDPELRVKHLKGWTAANMVATDLFDRAVPWTELLLRRGRAELDLNLDAPSRASVFIAFGVLASLIATAFDATAGWIALAGLVLLLVLNAPFYAFLARTRSPAFAALAIPWHWLYFLYGGVGFVVGVGRYIRRRRGPGDTVTSSDVLQYPGTRRDRAEHADRGRRRAAEAGARAAEGPQAAEAGR
jgi:glycosyltransferase involved in cell wall biosynthesis